MRYRLPRSLLTTALFLLVSACSSLPPPTPAVEQVDGHIGGFDIKYKVNVTSAKPLASDSGKPIDQQWHADGTATLSLRVGSNKRFVSDLNMEVSYLGVGGMLRHRSQGVFRDNLPAMDALSSMQNTTAMASKAYTVKVDYEKKQVVFSERDISQVQVLSQDRVLDLVSAIIYLRTGLQQGAIARTPNHFTLPIAGRTYIQSALVTIEQAESLISTYEFHGTAVPVTITLKDKDKNKQQMTIWFAPEADYLPLRIDQVTSSYKITFLSDRHK